MAEADSKPEFEFCIECGDQHAEVTCLNCDEFFCRPCWDQQHRRGKRAKHEKKPLLGEMMAESAGTQVPVPEISSGEAAAPQPESKTSHPRASSRVGIDQAEVYMEDYAYIPLRLSQAERNMLKVVEGALKTSEYTDEVDIRSYKRDGIIKAQRADIIHLLLGLNAVANYKQTRKLVQDDIKDHQELLQNFFEIARRFKIMNPDLMRSTYGKLMYLLQDSCQGYTRSDIRLRKPIVTVKAYAEDLGIEAILDDPMLKIATKDITFTEGDLASVEVESKRKAMKELIQEYSSHVVSAEDIERIVYSISDSNNYQATASGPVIQMLTLLHKHFPKSKPHELQDLSIDIGRQGCKLQHKHTQQYTYVEQTLTLWKEITQKMFFLWWMADRDLLSESARYHLSNTGQGLQRVQSCPEVNRAMQSILHSVQRRCGPWVGISVVHLGDRDVPNALIFIDKYTQVPRILAPIVRTIERVDELATDPYTSDFIIKTFGTAEALKVQILRDFFRLGFNGDGDDGGSCIDGRLTSAWNWCSKLDKKPFRDVFMLTGFEGFDGSFSA
eukprot:TRINITY_DN6511_c0_g1_i3.p1 TRINITY_DN6511_c0_g1~~TRINITY_DN6511_c0_g1_i3.p1  ORF type:complete len:556 (+),score=111.15 TRINITY_DN6511_c0_g1_i3:107-1774(+)